MTYKSMELGPYFDLVKDPENWKMPTKPYRTTNPRLVEKIIEAIAYFTGGDTDYSKKGKVYTVHSSTGYYVNIGA